MEPAEITLTRSIIQSFVDHPDDVQVRERKDDRGQLLTVKVHRDDMGKVIGKQGDMANAIRMILRAMGAKQDKQVTMKVDEPDGRFRPRHDDPVSDTEAEETDPRPGESGGKQIQTEAA